MEQGEGGVQEEVQGPTKMIPLSMPVSKLHLSLMH